MNEQTISVEEDMWGDIVVATKRRLERIMNPHMPVPLSPDAHGSCDRVAARRAVEVMERDQREASKQEAQAFRFKFNARSRKKAAK